MSNEVRQRYGIPEGSAGDDPLRHLREHFKGTYDLKWGMRKRERGRASPELAKAMFVSRHVLVAELARPPRSGSPRPCSAAGSSASLAYRGAGSSAPLFWCVTSGRASHRQQHRLGSDAVMPCAMLGEGAQALSTRHDRVCIRSCCV